MRGNILRLLTLAAVAGLALPVVAQVRSRTIAPEKHVRAAKAPYTAHYTITIVQTLANGNTLTREHTEVEALDSQGRRMFARTFTSEGRQPVTHVSVHDPVAKTETYWKVPGKRATVIAVGAPGAARGGCLSTKDADPDSVPVTSGPHPTTTTENLGTASIQGVEAHGTRRTETIPAGAMGNEAPLVSTLEEWKALSVGLNGLLVRLIRDDPRSGKTTRELTELEQAEPDPSVFQPPAGYEIVTKDASACPDESRTGETTTEPTTK
jgi:hypothetical protein